MGNARILHGAPKRSNRLFVALFAALGLLALIGVWLARAPWWNAGRAADGRSSPGGEETSTLRELGKLKEEVKRLEQQVAIQNAFSILRAENVPPREPEVDGGRGTAAPPSDEEVQRAMHETLDQQLVEEPGEARDRRTAEAVLHGEVTQALVGRAKIVEITCASTFCKLEVEEDTTLPERLDLALVGQHAPSLRHEAIYKYNTQGNLKRTTMYVARDGHTLPLPRAEEMNATDPGAGGPPG